MQSLRQSGLHTYRQPVNIAVVTGKLVTAVITPAPAGIVSDALAVEVCSEPESAAEFAVVGAPINGFARTETTVPVGMFDAARSTVTGPLGAV